MGAINGYHKDVPDWRDTSAQKSGELFGIELEVFHEGGRQIAADALDRFKVGKYAKPIAERDGSLSETLGVEIICPPLPPQELAAPHGYIARLMERLQEVGASESPPDGYGMHVNINLADWKPVEKLMVQYLLNRFYRFGTIVGRRTTGFGAYIPVYRTRLGQNSRTLEYSTHPGGKHAAAHIRRVARTTEGNGLVLEVRLPKSTLDIRELHTAIDYVYALRKWVISAPNHTHASIFLDRLTFDGNAGDQTPTMLDSLFLGWASKYAPKVAELLAPSGVVATKAEARKRLLTMQDEAKGKDYTTRFNNTGLTYDDPSASSAKQAIRISTLIGKGAELTGEQRTSVYNRLISVSSVRAVD